MTIERETQKDFIKLPLQAEITVICGPMFSSKSTRLIGMISRMPHAGLNVVAFKPEVDTRRGKNSINTENGLKFPAVSVRTSLDILQIYQKRGSGIDVFAIDEGQFFDSNLPDVCNIIARGGKAIIIAGLDKDFRGEPFGPMGRLKEIADKIHTLHAFCSCCKREATRTQRIIVGSDGVRRPASYKDPIVLVGATEVYEARCRDHHEVPGKPEVVFNEAAQKQKLVILLSGVGPVEDNIETILKKMGCKVYRPPKGDKDINLQTDDERSLSASCQAAVFGPGSNSGIGEVREWIKTKKPSLGFARKGSDGSRLYSNPIYTRFESFDTEKELKQQLKDFTTQVRIQLTRTNDSKS